MANTTNAPAELPPDDVSNPAAPRSLDAAAPGTVARKEGTETMRKTGWCETCKHRSTLNKRQCPYVLEGLLFAEAKAKSCPKWEKG